ncbi:glycoside hydrolase domain-containing protein [Paenarthrobacter nicotinovorans]|uniref:glycoside hydrolase domain-containing protein n=1 Tax=Paenarthrobacter nicotinovorans TaxID=29320 RepID=UPI002485F08E|nr:glycoside hydrolase domain-containing protein [Paenarthrobacter nicotinovorans]MDI2020248.1 hypothetical protein [Paenarthrobacter nicotinovorans]
MVDPQVIRAQMFINSYNVPGIPKLPEDGLTGWQVMYALTRALQYELGITALSDAFGPTTLATLQSKYPVIDGSLVSSPTVKRIYKILQSALYCKGYDGGSVDGSFNANVVDGVTKLKSNLGVTAALPGVGVTPKLFKALLTMDAYVLLPGGDAAVRAAQQWLNATYLGRREFFLVPTDGFFSRDVQKALMFAIQYQIGMSDDVANGYFGPGTQNGIRATTLAVGSTGTWVQLFTAAMIFNKRTGVEFSASFTSQLSTLVTTFQQFAMLPVTGKGDFQTWASLLVSTGDVSRKGTAADCITTITPQRAAAMKAAGHVIIGRYLSNAPGSTWNKMIEPGEIAAIVAAGLRVFPIYQTWGGAASYFNPGQGQADALAAIQRLKFYGFKPGTTVYFAVDFDALDHEVTESIVPHFRGIKSAMDFSGSGYKIGIYGPRNICSRVSAAGISTSSFVSDMSTGFSGNLGYPLPVDWAFDQISTITVGAGDGTIEIDNNISSGRDLGQNTFNASKSTLMDVSMDPALKPQMLADVQAYMESVGVPEEGLEYEGTPVWTIYTNTQAVETIFRLDAEITAAAKRFNLPKSLVQCPILWEYRKYSQADTIADAGVRAYYAGQLGLNKDDSSTGLAQIFGRTAIDGQNFCIENGFTQGALLDRTNRQHVWSMWNKLQDELFTVNMVPQVLHEAAAQSSISLDRMNAESDYQEALKQYNGDGVDAISYGQQLIGLYRVLEKYNGFLRNR